MGISAVNSRRMQRPRYHAGTREIREIESAKFAGPLHHLFYESPIGDYVYLKHPPEVVEIAAGLAALTRDQFADRWEQVAPNPDSDALGLSFTRAEADEFWPCVEGVREFYQRAASEGLAVLLCWG
jgi:hypothetical protein